MNLQQPFGSAHQDILEAKPETDAARLRLRDECKDRAKRAVQAQHWPDALVLYQKALECCTSSNSTGDDAEDRKHQQSILHSNLALVHGKMNQWAAANDAATQAVELDPNYVKAWWRLGQAQVAQGMPAVASLEHALALEPDNKALQKELAKVKASALEAPTTAKSTTTTTTTTKQSTKPTSTPSKKATSSSTSSDVEMKDDDDDDDEEDVDFTRSDHVKGYKIINGKKTSYFHNELSDDAKQLIGDIAPQKLHSFPNTTTSSANATKDKGTSAWNSAGTWEEINVTQWGKESLEQTLATAKYQHPTEGMATVTNATVTGHASVATVRGKKRYLYEWSILIQWSFQDCTGSVKFPDVDGTCTVGEPYDASDFVVSTGTRTPLVDQCVLNGGLRMALHQAIDAWVQVFQKSY